MHSNGSARRNASWEIRAVGRKVPFASFNYSKELPHVYLFNCACFVILFMVPFAKFVTRLSGDCHTALFCRVPIRLVAARYRRKIPTMMQVILLAALSPPDNCLTLARAKGYIFQRYVSPSSRG